MYLLVKESPEHGQGDVKEQNLQHHLHLGNQEFLHQSREDHKNEFLSILLLVIY